MLWKSTIALVAAGALCGCTGTSGGGVGDGPEACYGPGIDDRYGENWGAWLVGFRFDGYFPSDESRWRNGSGYGMSIRYMGAERKQLHGGDHAKGDCFGDFHYTRQRYGQSGAGDAQADVVMFGLGVPFWRDRPVYVVFGTGYSWVDDPVGGKQSGAALEVAVGGEIFLRNVDIVLEGGFFGSLPGGIRMDAGFARAGFTFAW